MAASLDVGRDANGDPCRATRTYDDETLKGAFDAGFVITCRTVTASRSVGTIRSVVEGSETSPAVEATLSCGQPASAQVGFLRAQARRCYDSHLRTETVVMVARSADRTIIGSAAPAVIEPLERGILALAGGGIDPRSAVEPGVDVASLASPPLPVDAAARADSRSAHGAPPNDRSEPRGSAHRGVANRQ